MSFQAPLWVCQKAAGEGQAQESDLKMICLTTFNWFSSAFSYTIHRFTNHWPSGEFGWLLIPATWLSIWLSQGGGLPTHLFSSVKYFLSVSHPFSPGLRFYFLVLFLLLKTNSLERGLGRQEPWLLFRRSGIWFPALPWHTII